VALVNASVSRKATRRQARKDTSEMFAELCDAQQKRIDQLEAQIAANNAEITSLKAQIRGVEEENAGLKCRVKELEDENAALKREIALLKERPRAHSRSTNR
jgi:peptidoglycan hydrolase CwlO-like protein